MTTVLSRPVLVLIVMLTLAFAGHSLLKPKYAWDSMHYSGCILSALYGGSWEEKHARTQAYLAARFPPAVFEQLTTSPPGISPYRSIVANDPEAFRQTQPVYCYKIGFVGPALALSWMGLDPHLSLQIMSAIPAALLFGVTAVWLSRRIGPHRAIPLCLVGLFAMLFQTARYEYPDGLAALAMGGALILYAEGRRNWAVAAFFLAIVVRADAIVYFGAFLAVGTFLSHPTRRFAFWRGSVPLGLAALALYTGIVAIMQPPGYSAVFHHSLVAQTPYLQSSNAVVGPSLYLDILWRQLGVLAVDGAKLFVMVPIALAGFWFGRKDPSLSRFGEAGMMSVAMVVLHYLIFPYYDPRYYAAPYLMMIVGGGSVLAIMLTSKIEGFRERCAD